MIDQARASHFLVTIFSQDVDFVTSLKVNMKKTGFQVESFSEIEVILNQIEASTPHILVIDLSSLIVSLDQFIERALSVSQEIKFIFITKEDQFDLYESYYTYNMVALLNKKEINFDKKIIQVCSLLAESLYRFFQNEHFYNLLNEEKEKRLQLEQLLKNERSSSKVRPYQIRIADYKSCQSKEELLDVFYQQTPLQSWIYLKFIASIDTFISVSHHQILENWVEGLSYKVLDKGDYFRQQIFQGQLPTDMESYLLQKLNIKQLKFMPLLIKNNIEGLMISTQEITAESAEDFSLMSLVYTNLVYESQPKYLDVEDSLTGFYNHLFYKRVLEKEYERSKRSLSPLTVIKISADKFREIETVQGKIVADEILKKVAYCIEQTSRLTDYVCRTDENEFSIILVNCHRAGAAIRAERLRELLTKENFTKKGIRLTVSQGISEYPTTAQQIEDLNESALKALSFISDKGGDKICLAKAHPGHKPDFPVQE